MRKIILLLAFLSVLYCFYGCKEEDNQPSSTVVYEQGRCTVLDAENGALVSCSDGTKQLILDGVSYQSSSTLWVIDPCGDGEGFDEIILQLDEQLLCYFEEGDKRFLTELSPGNYITTDRQECNFTITEDLEVIFE